MKKIVFLLASLLFVFKVNAQCDNPFYQLKEGTVIVMESYDGKEKFQSRSETNITNFEETNNGFIATVSYKLSDKKEKVIAEGEYKMECDAGVMKIDMSSFVPAESMAAFKDMDMEITTDQLAYPSSLESGQVLNDASFSLTASSGPIPMKMDFDITNRKVEGKESVSTPAGAFDCYKITYNTHTKMMMANMNFNAVEYLSEKCGVVKTESYKSNGNLMGYTILTKYAY